MATHEMIIAIPKNVVETNQSFLFQHYVYKNYASLTYEELVSYEMNKENDLNNSISKAEIREKFPTLLSFGQENIRIIKKLTDEISDYRGEQKITHCVKLFEYINTHCLYPLFTDNFTSFYYVILIKILDLFESSHGNVGQSEHLINSLLDSVTKLFRVSDDEIQILINKYYEVYSLSSNIDFFTNWCLFLVYRCPNFNENCLVRVKKIDTKDKYLQHFSNMKLFFDDLLVQLETEQERSKTIENDQT